MELDKKLIEIGLSPKEARVYLASLALGPASVQQIARRAQINRPTTYVMVDSLSKKGLISTFEKGKKRYFIAEAPERLRALFHSQRRAIDDKEHRLNDILPELRALSGAAELPKVRLYEGAEGLEAIHGDLLKVSDIDVVSIFSADDAQKVLHKEHVDPFRKKLLERKAKERFIYTSSAPPTDIPKEWEGRRVPKDKFPFSGEVSTYGDRVALLSYRGKLVGVLIESRELAQTVRAIFELAWEAAAKYGS
ncbi:hypothetical protein HYT45_03790 [Candidatus Uhrbacteria bacterium]|nr:hypothetical protein [Candidatus Uhrbacteria bacterium]